MCDYSHEQRTECMVAVPVVAGAKFFRVNDGPFMQIRERLTLHANKKYVLRYYADKDSVTCQFHECIKCMCLSETNGSLTCRFNNKFLYYRRLATMLATRTIDTLPYLDLPDLNEPD